MRSSAEDESAKSLDPGKDRVSTTQELCVLHNKEDEIESAKAEIEKAREENERLKRMLEQMNEDYRSLKREFSGILRRAKSTRSVDHPDSLKVAKLELKPEPACLSLGIRPVESDKELKKEMGRRDKEEFESGFGLRLNTKLQLSPQALSTSNSVHSSLPENQEDMDARETWSPSKLQKTEGNGDGDGNEATPLAQVKRARVSVRARCDSHTMNDGCQWRKYGQKISKGNPCPRAYYRCTVAPACPVRKQVQRCLDDMSILVTTYEGTHNHPLPVSATAMASTTSAAASMLLSGSSSTSQTALGTNATTLVGLDGLRSKLPFYYPNTPAPLHPTITLDLTTNSSTPITNSANLNRYYSRPALHGSSPGFSDNVPNIWDQSRQVIGLDKQSRDPPRSLTETLTKMLTTDPAFQSIITAAVQSMIGNNKSHLTELPSFPLLQYPASSSISDTASKPMLEKDSIGL